MKQRIIQVSGFGGTGKTTAANILFSRLTDCALVEADHLFIIKPWAIGERLGRVKLRNSLSVMRNFAVEGFLNIICVGLVWSQAELEAVEKEFTADQFDLFLFWLKAKKNIRFDRVVARGEPGDTLEFLEHVESNVPNPWPFKSSRTLLKLIEADNLTPDHIGQMMYDKLNVAQSKL